MIRLATQKDCIKIIELANEAKSRGEFFFSKNPKDTYHLNSCNEINGYIERGDEMYVYEKEGKIFALSHWINSWNTKYNIYTYTSPSLRNEGIGKNSIRFFWKGMKTFMLNL